MDLPLSPLETVACVGIVAVGSWVQGSIGFGVAVVSAPFLVLIESDLVPGPMIANALVLTLLMMWRERNRIDLGGVAWTCLGGGVGIAAAAALLRVISESVFGILFSGLVLFAVLLSALGRSVSPTRRNVLIAGTLSGFMGTMSSIGGPPVALVYQRVPGPRLRATLSTFFTFAGLVALLALASVDRFGSREGGLTLCLLPGLLAGFFVSGRSSGWVDRFSLRPAVLALSAMAAIGVLVRNLV